MRSRSETKNNSSDVRGLFRKGDSSASSAKTEIPFIYTILHISCSVNYAVMDCDYIATFPQCVRTTSKLHHRGSSIIDIISTGQGWTYDALRNQDRTSTSWKACAIYFKYNHVMAHTNSHPSTVKLPYVRRARRRELQPYTKVPRHQQIEEHSL